MVNGSTQKKEPTPYPEMEKIKKKQQKDKYPAKEEKRNAINSLCIENVMKRKGKRRLLRRRMEWRRRRSKRKELNAWN